MLKSEIRKQHALRGIMLVMSAVLVFACMGLASLLGHTLFTAAYGQAPASLLAPFNYFHIAWAVIIGWLVFRHIPGSLALSGMALIAISGAAIAIHSHFARATPEEV
jgi:drug/metabolite transporter (DMT)-like permease